MAVAHVTKGPHLYSDDATLKSNMDHRDNPSTRDDPSANDRRATDSLHVIDDLIDEERLKKIAKLKQAVADGTYHVSAEDLADKLIAHMLEPKG
jgi:anti-sigma28 factor (negative regulator of flagellin synthesis)